MQKILFSAVLDKEEKIRGFNKPETVISKLNGHQLDSFELTSFIQTCDEADKLIEVLKNVKLCLTNLR